MTETTMEAGPQDRKDSMKRGPCPEHMRVLFDCVKESFYQRGLPLAGILGLSTYAAIKTGYLKPAKRLGVFPKVTLAVISGIVIGRISYQSICMERMKQLHGGNIPYGGMVDCYKKKFNCFKKSSDELQTAKPEDKTT